MQPLLYKFKDLKPFNPWGRGGGGVFGILSDGDNQRIFWGFEIFWYDE